MRFVDGKPGEYEAIFTDINSFPFRDDGPPQAIHGTKLQLCLRSKNTTIDAQITDRMSFALECVLGFFDEHLAWQHPFGATIQSRGLYRSHASTQKVLCIGKAEITKLRKVLAFTPSLELSEHKYKTFLTLLNAARHQGEHPTLLVCSIFPSLRLFLLMTTKSSAIS